MVMTDAGRRLLHQLGQRSLFEELELEDPTSSQGLEPWDGQSPRDLTEAHKRFILGHEGASLNAEDAAIDEQCRRHLNGW